MAAKRTHNPITLILFIIGLVVEAAASSYVGTDLYLNGAVVLLTALYFYTMDDIEALIRKVL